MNNKNQRISAVISLLVSTILLYNCRGVNMSYLGLFNKELKTYQADSATGTLKAVENPFGSALISIVDMTDSSDVAGLTVLLKDSLGNTVQSVTSDSNGLCFFNDIIPGVYKAYLSETNFPERFSLPAPQIVFSSPGLVYDLVLQLTEADTFNVTTSCIQGYIYDADTREPLVGARITTKKQDSKILTDKMGRFSMDSISPGIKELIVSADGYISNAALFYLQLGECNQLHIGMKRPSKGQIVGNNGTTINVPNAASMTIPPNALLSPTEISITSLPDSIYFKGYDLSKLFTPFRLSPHETIFKKGVLLKIPLLEPREPGTEIDIYFSTFKDSASQIVKTAKVSKTGRELEVEIDEIHSTIAVIAPFVIIKYGCKVVPGTAFSNRKIFIRKSTIDQCDAGGPGTKVTVTIAAHGELEFGLPKGAKVKIGGSKEASYETDCIPLECQDREIWVEKYAIVTGYQETCKYWSNLWLFPISSTHTVVTSLNFKNEHKYKDIPVTDGEDCKKSDWNACHQYKCQKGVCVQKATKASKKCSLKCQDCDGPSGNCKKSYCSSNEVCCKGICKKKWYRYERIEEQIVSHDGSIDFPGNKTTLYTEDPDHKCVDCQSTNKKVAHYGASLQFDDVTVITSETKPIFDYSYSCSK